MTSDTPTLFYLTRDNPLGNAAAHSPRELAILQSLAKNHPVVLMSLQGHGENPNRSERTSPAATLPTNIEEISIHETPLSLFETLRLKWLPEVLGRGKDPAVISVLRERARPGDLIWISRLEMAPYIPLARSLKLRVILDERAAESSFLLRTASSSIRRWHRALLAAQCAYYEERYCNAAHHVIATSELEASRLRKIAPQIDVSVIPECVSSPIQLPADTTPLNRIVFPAFLNRPTHVEGAYWFIKNVSVRLKAALGMEAPEIWIADLSGMGTVPKRLWKYSDFIHRFKDRTQRTYREALPNSLKGALAAVFPIQGEPRAERLILEAMAFGSPVISTPQAMMGLSLTPTYDILIADDADGFTSSILKLIRDTELRAQLIKRAGLVMEMAYDRESVEERVSQALDQLETTAPRFF